MWTIMMSAWHHFRIGKKGTLSESARLRYNSFVQSFAVDFPGRYRGTTCVLPHSQKSPLQTCGKIHGQSFWYLGIVSLPQRFFMRD